MNKQDKLKLFWKIIRRINKKFCKNKVKINKIVLFEQKDLHKSFPKKRGWYFQDERNLLIKEDEPLLLQIIIVIHEFTHAYEDQILGYSGKRRNKHDEEEGKIYRKFLKSTEDILKIS